MRDYTFERKKAATSTFSHPSLVSPHTPTLANPERGFGLPTNNIVQAQTAESANQQAAQSTDEQSLLSETIQQRSFGHDLSRISFRPQAKLTVGEPGDKYEQEADWMANQVMRMVVPDQLNAQSQEPVEDSLQRKCAACEQEEDKVQTKPSIQTATDGGLQAGNNIESRLNSSKGGGSPLADEVRSFMEPRFGADFSSVRVHTDREAVQMNRELGAQAFTHGSDVYFGAGKSAGNNDLTAHELTHVVQQTGGIGKQETNLQRKQQNDDISSQPNSKQTDPQVSQINQSQTPASTIAKPSQLPANQETATIAQTATQTDGKPKTNPEKPTAITANPSNQTQAPASAIDDPDSNNSFNQPVPSSSGGSSTGGGSAPNPPTDSAPPPNPQLNTSSSEGLLLSIASTPASSFGQALTQSQSAATQIQSQEKADLETSLPEIERPTGLPSTTERKNPVPTLLPSDQPPELKIASGRDGAPPEVNHEEPRSPVPGSQVSTAVSAQPQDDGGGSWWNWLVNRVNNFLGSISTHDAGLSTSAGSRPNVDTSGEADPTQNIHNQQKSEQEVSTRKGAADQAIAAHFGENEIYPTVSAEKLRSTYKPTAPTGAKGAGIANPPNLPEDMRTNFDQQETPKLSIQVNEQAAQYRQQQAKYQQESQETRKQGQQRITQENEQTRIEQLSIQQQAKGDVDAERQRWREENQQIQEKYANQSKDKQQEIDRQIQEKVQSTEKETDQKLTEAEQKAETERQNTERVAADKKREAENKPRSFWDSVKDSISSVFDSLRQTISGLFEGLRKLVKGIIEAAKTAVRTLIEAARTIIVGLIKGFGEFLKGLVSVALAAFPEAAAKARAWIDKRVDTATNAVNAAAEKLKLATDAILDWVGETLDQALSLVQDAFNLILDGLEFLAKAPFEMMELLAKLAETLKQYGAFIDGLEELMNNPAALEAAAQETLQGYIDQIPDKAHEVIQGAIEKVGAPPADSNGPSIQLKEEAGSGKKAPSSLQKHLQGIWRHLEPGLLHIKANWWTEIKKMVWDLVWPFNDQSPIWKDVPEMIHLPGKIFSSLWNGQFSQAVDQYLQFVQKINSILGLFYGWFFIASVLVGTIIGAFFGGAGAIPGAAAGAAFAGEVGEGLLIAMVATETAIIGKAVFDLVFGPDTESANENAYDRIASSGLTLGITGVFILLSAIAGKIASELVSGVKGLFKGEVPEAPGVKVDAPEVKPDAPEVKGGATSEPPGETKAPEEGKPTGENEGQKPGSDTVEVEEPSLDGEREVQVTEDGGCKVCASPCDKIRNKYRTELDNNPEIEQRITEIENSTNSKSNKAKQYQEIEQQLADIRKANRLKEEPQRLRDSYADELADPANKSIKERLDAAEKITDPELKQKELADIQRDLTSAKHPGKEGGYHGSKPEYTNPGHHDPSSPNFRGRGDTTTPLPKDAAQVYENAIPDQDGKNWYGQNADGEFYRYQPNGGNDSGVHWNGREQSPRGLEVPSYVRRRFNAIK
jgi:hypothetical protein